MKKPTVTVAIPAYNEEKNIVQLLMSIKMQKHTNHKLEAIWVYSDGSRDRTAEMVRKNFKEVHLVDSKKNLGKNKRVNQIMRNNKSDILIQIDADIKIKDKNVFDNLVSPMLRDGSIGIACAYHLATEPITFVGELSYFGFNVWNNARNKLGKAGVRYYCEGGMRAFSKAFTEVFSLPEGRHIGEDSYSFYFAVGHSFTVVACKRAKVYIDLAESYRDYTKQMKRFLQDSGMVVETFDTYLAEKYEIMTSKIKMKALVEEFVRQPFVGLCYLCLQSLTKAQARFYKPGASWVPITRS